jgi:hypothetical protein
MSTGTRTVAWHRPALRALQLVVLAAGIAIALMLFAGRAHADTATPTAGSNAAVTQTPPVPAAGPGPSGSNPATPAPATPPGAATSTKLATRTAYSTPSPSASTSSATTPVAPATPPVAPSQNSPSSTGTQQATVGNTGVAVSQSGANSAVGVTSQVPPAGAPPATSGAAKPGLNVGTGGANATGVDAQTGITQQVQANARDAGQIHIVQIALVIDIGVAEANSGHNAGAVASAGPRGALAAGFGPRPGSGSAVAITTGNGRVVGAQGTTGVIQSARITNGDATSQSTFVVNIGLAFGNSGANVALVGHAVAQKGMSAVGIAKIATGTATAIGDRSRSGITQSAILSATDAGVLNVDQRAIILNIGIAIANTGLNGAGDSLSSLTGQDGALVQAILEQLLGGSSGLVDGVSANGSAGIHTGSMLAIGNDSMTTIGQAVNGAVSGTGSASAQQQAFVANLGIAVGNSGANLAALGISPTGVAQLDTLDTSVASFLDSVLHPTWLTGGTAAPDVQSMVNLGGTLLQVSGDASGTLQHLATTTDPTGASVTVEQVSGVLHVSVALADTGGNLALYSGPLLDEAVAAHGLTDPGGTLVASITTGNVDATGARFGVTICQSEHDHACDVPVPQTPPPGGHTPTPPVSTPVQVPVVEAEVLIRPASLPEAPAAAQAAATSLPFTGSGSLPEEALAAIAAIGAGLAAQLTRRRRAATPQGDDGTGRSR